MELRPVTLPGDGYQGLERFSALTRREVANERGFFAFEDVSPGMYEVRAEAAGMAPARVRPVRVHQGRETEVGILHLAPPIVLEGFIDPPTDPGGHPWSLELDPETLTATEDLPEWHTRSEPSGAWSFSEVPPGEYRLEVRSRDGRISFRRELEAVRHGSPVTLELPLVSLEGRLTRDDEPVRAQITLENREDRRTLRFDTDDEGRFGGTVPGGGKWKVKIEYPGDPAEHRLRPVELADRGEQVLELEVPDTRLAGRVVDEAGRPVPKIRIWVWNLDENIGYSRSPVDGQGRFTFVGIPEAHYTISPMHRHLTGDTQQVQIREGEALDDVEIVVEGTVDTRLRVVSDSGPLVGAAVSVHPETPGSRRIGLSQGVTGTDGVYDFSVPRSTTALNVMVLPPGYAARIFVTPFEPGRPLEVPVADFGGTLRIEGGEDPRFPGFRLFHGGAEGWAHSLRRWAELHGVVAPQGGVWTIPAMEVGDYRLCSKDRSECIDGYLPPYGELALALPQEDAPAK